MAMSILLGDEAVALGAGMSSAFCAAFRASRAAAEPAGATGR